MKSITTVVYEPNDQCDSKFIKSRQWVRLAEVMILDFIARNTTIPIPRVLDDRLAPGEWGPFDDRADRAALREFLGLEPAHIPRTLSPCTRSVIHSTQTTVTSRTVFAHDDLAPHNIHWKHGRIVVI